MGNGMGFMKLGNEFHFRILVLLHVLFCHFLRAPGIKVESYHGSKKEKERSLAKIRRKGGVLLTSYGLVVTSWEMMSQQDGRSFRWVIFS